jgi:anaerobic magnesium-protoporphyrin IX monomethyl ester cyclase
VKKVLFIGAGNPASVDDTLYAPLWPAYLAAHAERSLGPNALEFRFTAGRIENALASYPADLIAISSVTKNYGYAKRIAHYAKCRGLPVMIGGMHISSLPESLSPEMDAGCIGEGEATFTDLMRVFLETGGLPPRAIQDVRGIVYNGDGSLVRTPARPAFSSIDEIPHPRRRLIGYDRRSYIYTARGCAYNCSFCSCHRYWGRVRYASPGYIMEEVEELVRHGARVIRFADENFTADAERLGRIAGLLSSEGYNRRIRFSCWARARNVTPETVQILKSMNVVSVKMGLESGSDKILKEAKGSASAADNMRAINLLKDAGIQTNADFIVGFPSETANEMTQTYDFIKDSRLDFVDINSLCPLPATEVWKYAMKRNLVSEDMDWSRLSYKFSYDCRRAIVLSESLSHAELCKIHAKFAKLRARKTFTALLHTPWKNEIPGMAIRILREEIGRILGGPGSFTRSSP